VAPRIATSTQPAAAGRGIRRVSDLVAKLGAFIRRRLWLVLIALLACGFLSLGAIEAWRDSPTFDEPVYVSSGLTALRTGELSLNDEHPPLAKVLAVLPVFLAHPVIPIDHGAGTNDEHAYSAAFLQAQIRAGTLRAVDFASRIVPLLESVVLALLLYGLGSDLYGAPAGCFCAALWLASPLVLGLGHLDGVDIPFALAVVGFSWALLRWMRARSRRRLLILGIAGGIAALTNASGLLIVTLGVMVVPAEEIGHGRRRAALAGLTFALTALASIWLVYIALDPATLGAGAGLLPHPYVEGLRYLASHDTSPVASYLASISWTGGRWWYWPLSLAIKLPPATVAVLLLGPLGLLGLDRATRREVAIVAALPALVLFAFDLSLSRDIGVRYLLPVVALWLVVASAASARSRGRSVFVGLAVVVGLGVWAMVASFPHSLSWTDPVFGAPYQAATNSSVDWGQDLFAVQGWDRAHLTRVAYFGPRGIMPADTGQAAPLIGVPPARITGWVAVSATDLTTVASLAWLRAYCPVDRIGETILVYRFTHPPSALAGPGDPASPCRGSVSSRKT
jgi:4-amino-4-deoxy-L-arabinose transferase-like glycosyltransferase